MKFQDIHALVGNVPYISKTNGRYLYDLILRDGLTNILELGIAHGRATCYMAAALHEIGAGCVTGVDLIETNFKPSAEELLEKAGLSEFARIVRTQTGYTWFLHDEIAHNTNDNVCEEVYDLCIIDGPKNWTIDGAAFFFVDKLLKNNGWLVFDDYNWTYGAADRRRDVTDGITHRLLSKDERNTPHIREVFELLVKQHPNYGKLLVLNGGDWALAQKSMPNDQKTYGVVYQETTRDVFAKIINKALIRYMRPRHA